MYAVSVYWIRNNINEIQVDTIARHLQKHKGRLLLGIYKGTITLTDSKNHRIKYNFNETVDFSLHKSAISFT